MSDSPIERENLTAALVREYDDEALVVWIHLLQDHGEEQEAEVERLRADPRMRLAVEDIRRLMGPPNSPSYGPALRRVEAALAGEGDGDHSRPT